MKKLSFNQWIIVLLVIMNVGAIGCVWVMYSRMQDHPRHEGPPPRHHVEELFQSELGWDEAQLAEFQKLAEPFKAQMHRLGDQERSIKEEMWSLLADPNSESKVQPLIQKIGGIHVERETLAFVHMQAVRTLCTPEQQAAFDQLWQELRPKFLGPPRRRPE